MDHTLWFGFGTFRGRLWADAAPMEIALFGGTGFIGVHACIALHGAGHTVVVISRGDRAHAEAIEHRCCDATTAIDASVLAGCDAIVNLIGIKRERERVTFERAHVRAVEHIIEAARAAGITRLVHVSVSASASRPGLDPYLDTKHRGEELVRASGLVFTILRPGVVYGSGDDMLHNLVATLRHLPFFPAPAGGRAELAVVDVEDVATAISRCFERADARERTYDIVGPERLTVRELVEQVADAAQLPTRVVGIPTALLRLPVALMEATMAEPPLTRAQLGMLADGVVGDPEPARVELGLQPRSLTQARIHGIANEPGNAAALFGISFRGGWPLRLALGVGILNAAALVPASLGPAEHWVRVGGSYALAFVLLGAWFRLPWRELWRVTPTRVGVGVCAAVGLYLATAIGFALLGVLAPDLAGQASQVYAWGNALQPGIAAPALLAIVLAEEIYWRAGVGLMLAEHNRPWFAVTIAALGFAAAHLSVGPPLLWLAALVCGGFWTWLIVRTRSLVVSIVAHLLWDIAVLWLRPLA